MNYIQELIEDIIREGKCSEAIIAKEIGVSSATIYRIRRGITKNPKFEIVYRLFSLYFSIRYKQAPA